MRLAMKRGTKRQLGAISLCGVAALLLLCGCQRLGSGDEAQGSSPSEKKVPSSKTADLDASTDGASTDGAATLAPGATQVAAAQGTTPTGPESQEVALRLSMMRDKPRPVSKYLYGDFERDERRRAWMRSSASFVLSREAAKTVGAPATESRDDATADTTKQDVASLHKLVVLEGFADGVRTVFETSGARLVLYAPRDALWLVPTQRALVGVSSEMAKTQTEPAGDLTPGRVLHVGARLDWSEERDGALHGSFESDEIAFEGWVDLRKLGYVFAEESKAPAEEAKTRGGDAKNREVPREEAKPESSKDASSTLVRPALVRPGTALSAAPRGETIAMLGGAKRKQWIEIGRSDQENRGWNLIELSTREVSARGWVPISALSAPGELYGIGALGLQGVGRGGGGSRSTTWVFLPRGTKLRAAPDGEVVGITLRPLRVRQAGKQQVRVGPDELVPALTVAHDVFWASKRVLKRQKALDELLSVESREERTPKRGGLLDDGALATVRRHARDCLLDWAMQKELHGQSWDGETGSAAGKAVSDEMALGAAGLPWALPAGTFTLRSQLDGLRVSGWRASGPSAKLANCLETLPLRPSFSADAKKKLRKLEAPVAAVVLGETVATDE